MSIKLRINPHDGMRVTSKFGPRSGRFHSGVDIGALKRGVPGDRLYAVQQGVVKFVGRNTSSLGNYVIIEHAGFCTLYGHMHTINVSVGQNVNAGKQVGTMGYSGHVLPVGIGGTHLHFEIRACSYSSYWAKKNGVPVHAVNPSRYLLLTGNNGGLGSQFGASDDGLFTSQEDMFPLPDFPFTNYKVDGHQAKNYDKLFGRKYRIIVSDSKGNAYDVSQMHVIFNVKKTLLAEYHISNVFIYNLSPELENNIIVYGTKISIEAGYEGSFYGLIFEGDIVQAIRSKEDGVDYLLEIIAVDSERYLSSGFVNYNIKRGQTQRDVANILATKASNPVKLGSISDSFSESKLTRGKVVFGQGRDYLNQMAKGQNATFFMDNGKINLVKMSDVPDGEIISLTYDSGLVGTPTQTEYGMELKCLLNPQLKCNILVRVDKQGIVERQFQPGSIQYNEIDSEGIYRIIEISYTGDTRGQDWYCEINTIIQSGAYPSMLAEQSNSSF